jgi:hypothetical protein
MCHTVIWQINVLVEGHFLRITKMLITILTQQTWWPVAESVQQRNIRNQQQ